ncbi:hypothetical protein LCGC14_2020970 [marine sediment metagenome]|uniref:Uncharacterized protein n=1 Tax=marine sediment metagenome TaxID=412755 RepID=A0A0F9HUQ2_9ZZZZ
MVREPVLGKKQLVIELRALTQAITVTEVPERIDQHLQDIASLANKVQRQKITDNPYWLHN